MINLLTSGGLGDASMSFAKIFSKDSPFDINENINLTHITNVRGEGSFAESILQFYESQSIKTTIQLDHKGGGFRKKHRNEYDHYLGTHWDATNGEDESSWEINPFPPIKYEYIPGKDIFINPSSGLCVNTGSMVDDKVDKFKKDNSGRAIHINDTPKDTIFDLINNICSSNIIISHEGFCSFLGAMANKKVFVIPRVSLDNRQHPDWNMTRVKDISDIKL